jgi:dynein heavy chain, axonemal
MAWQSGSQLGVACNPYVVADAVFFADAVQHISRIARILRQPRGSALLVGVGGSGKASLTRFAAHMSDTRCVSIELSRAYGMAEFHEDIKKLFRCAL